MMKFARTFAAFAAFLFAGCALAQNSGTVTNHAFAIGKGAGVTGYTSLLCSSGQLALGTAGDPACVTMSGDATLNASGVLTLATVNANVGTWGSAANCVTLTIDAKGRVTAASQTACSAGGGISQLTGDGTAGPGSGSQVLTLATVNANVGTWGNGSTTCPSIAVNGKGLITSAGQGTCTPAIGSVTGLGTGVATALGTAVGSAGSFVTNGGALGTPSSGVGTNLTSLNATQLTSGTVPAARTNGHQNGTATNDNGAAGEIGEVISASVASGSAIALTSATAANITSISLTAGDWDVFGWVNFFGNASTSQTSLIGSVSTTSATLDVTTPFASLAQSTAAQVVGGATNTFSVGPLRASLAGTTTYFLVCRATFTVSTMNCFGGIRARRVR